MPHLTHLSHLDRDRHQKAGLDHLEGQPALDAKGDSIGKVSDALVEERTNRLRYLVVDADRWAAGKSVLIPVGLARVEDDAVYFDTLTREQVERLRPYRLGDEESVGALAENASVLRGAPVKAPAAGQRFDYETHEAEGGMFRTPARLRVVEERLQVRHVPAGTDPDQAAKADRAKKNAMIAGPVAAVAGLAAYLLSKRSQDDPQEVVVRRPVPMRTAYSPIAAGLVTGSERAARVAPPPQPVVMREELTTTPQLIATTHFKEEDMYQDRYMNRDDMRHDADRAAHEAAERASHEMHSASRSIGRRLRKDVHNEFDDVESSIRKALSDHDDHQQARMAALRRDLKKEIGGDLRGMLEDLSKSIAARPQRMDKRMSSLRGDLMKEIRHELKGMLSGTSKSLMSRQEKQEDAVAHLHEHAKNQQELLEDMNHQLEKVRRELRAQRGGGFPWMLVLLGAAGYYLWRNPEARQKLQDRAQQVIEQNPQLKEAAQHSKEAVQQGVQRVQQGESPLRVAKDTANEVKGDAQTAAQTAKDEAKETADKAKDQAKMAADKAKDQAKDVTGKAVSNTSGMGDTPRASDAMRGNEGNNRR